jgi:hypothetical protein
LQYALRQMALGSMQIATWQIAVRLHASQGFGRLERDRPKELHSIAHHCSQVMYMSAWNAPGLSAASGSEDDVA